MVAKDGIIPPELLAFIRTRNAKSPIRETYSSKVYDHFKSMRQIPFGELSKEQQEIIFREEEDEGLYTGNDPATVRWYSEYMKSIGYLFSKVDPDILPKSFVEDVDNDVLSRHSTCEAVDVIKKELARIESVERSIEKRGYDDRRPVTIYLVQSTRKATVGYGNHRLQAVRNLIARGILPRGFKIPVYVVYEDIDLKEKIKERFNKMSKAC